MSLALKVDPRASPVRGALGLGVGAAVDAVADALGPDRGVFESDPQPPTEKLAVATSAAAAIAEVRQTLHSPVCPKELLRDLTLNPDKNYQPQNSENPEPIGSRCR